MNLACLRNMGQLRQMQFVALLVAHAVIGCSTSSLMESTDDMGGTTSGSGTGSGSACSACFDTHCAWEVTECAADPSCSQWLSCARNAPAGAPGLDASWLAQSCVAPTSPTTSGLQSNLANCLTESSCCAENGGYVDDPDASNVGAGGAGGGAGPIPGSGGGNGGDYVDGDGGAENTSGWQCDVEERCCLYCFKALGSVDTLACESAPACVEDPACNAFFHLYAECVETAAANTSGDRQRAIEACLFQSSGETPPDAITLFMTTMFPCAVESCANHCFFDNAVPCLSCKAESCHDEMTSYAQDYNAMMGSWCRSYCQVHPDDGDCPGKCTPFLQEGAATLQSYGQCVQAACSGSC